MAFIVIGVDVGDDEGHVMHMVVGHRLPHAANHARQHEAFVITELAERFPAWPACVGRIAVWPVTFASFTVSSSRG